MTKTTLNSIPHLTEEPPSDLDPVTLMHTPITRHIHTTHHHKTTEPYYISRRGPFPRRVLNVFPHLKRINSTRWKSISPHLGIEPTSLIVSNHC